MQAKDRRALKLAKKTERKPKAEEKEVNSSGNKRGTSQESKDNLKKDAGPGRPKGLLNYKTRVTMAIEALAQKYIDDYNKKHPKGKQLTLDDVDILGDIFQQAVNKARNGDHKSIIDLFDRLYGKATQPVELSGKDGNPIEYEIKLKEAQERLKNNQAKWFKKK